MASAKIKHVYGIYILSLRSRVVADLYRLYLQAVLALGHNSRFHGSVV